MTTIGRVHLRTDTDDALATRMRGESALRALDLEPPAMPPRVILCIRAMPDPLPGGLDLRSAHAPRATEWEHAARNAIRAALSRAVRVGEDFVPADADSVVFEDRAELLACAARDVVRGRDGWWWRHLLRGSVTFTVVLREWMHEPEYVAAALEILAARGDVIAFVRKLEAQEAIALLHNVLRAHALEPFANEIIQAVTQPRTVAAPALSMTRQPPWHELIRDIEHAVAMASETGGLKPAAPQETAHELTIEQRLFAGITLALRRAPMLVRRRESFFAQQTIAWIHTMRAIEMQTTQTATPHEPDPQTPRLPLHSHPASANAPDTPSRQQSSGHRPQATGHSDPPPETRPQRSAIAPVAAPTVSTQYAGIFFLLNVAIALELYDPYSDEGLDLDVWTFLALTARELLEEVEIDEDDGVWALLADLAQPESSCGAAGFSPPADAPQDTLDRIRELLSLTLDAENPALFLIRRYGRITLTPAHLDVHFSLAAHPIEIRMSGLDRDPGWIPAAGRHVNFHFD